MTEKSSDINNKPKRQPVIFKKPSKVLNTSFDRPSTAKSSKNGKQSESISAKVERLEQEIELLTSYSTDTIYRLDYRSMKYDYISPAIFKLLGFTPAEMKKVNFRSLIVETKIVTDGLKTVESFEELEERRIGGDVGKWQADYLIRTKSADKIWVSDVSHPWFDKSGKIIGSVGSLREVTDRVNAEQEVREEEVKVKQKEARKEAEKENAVSEASESLVKGQLSMDETFQMH